MFDSMKKRCTKCGKAKPLDEFRRDRNKRSGYGQPCKECARNNFRDRYKADPSLREYVKQRNKKWSLKSANHKAWRQANRDKLISYEQNQKLKYPEKRQARDAVNNAIRHGKLPRATTLNCVYCGEPAKQYHHHHGYDKAHWLDVVPVCIPCHEIVDSTS